MSTAFDDSDELLAAYLAETGRAAEASGEAPRRLWEDGREVGEWTVTGFLSRGGSGEVYCAKHRRLGKRAALKVLWREEAGLRERFELETRFLMGNPGPSFPAFYGAGVEDGRPWVAMELLDECPAPATDRQVARYLLEVGAGVAAMHARGWLHRDLKFRNILRRADGHAVLADFGLLKAVGTGDAASDAASERDSPSVVDGREAGVGTPGFAAPEQFAGGGATAASDVYALGILAEECFGGKPPRAWEKIIRRATAALPRQRYPGVAPMLRAIRRRHRARNWAWALLAALCVAAPCAWLTGAWKAEMPQGMAPAPEAPPAMDEPAQPAPPAVPEAPPEADPEPPPEAVVAPAAPAEPTPAEKTEAPLPPPRPEPASRAPERPPERPPATAPRPEPATMAPERPRTVAPRGESVRAARAAALARFEAEEWRKEAIGELAADMQAGAPSQRESVPCRCGRHEVTQRQWMALMDANPSRFQGDDLPVDSLTLGACMEFLERLNATSVAKKEDLKFRLPTSWELSELAEREPVRSTKKRLAAGWFAENSAGRTHPVGEKPGNGRCADLFGNVRELTCSWGTADGKEGLTCLGGSWADSASEKNPAAVLEQPRFIRRHLLSFDESNHTVSTMPGNYPHEVCPAPGEIGFRLWAEPRAPVLDREVGEAAAYWESEEGSSW